MSLNDAREFLTKMKEDRNFRKFMLNSKSQEDVGSFLHTQDLLFDQRELIIAMAECMAQLDNQAGS